MQDLSLFIGAILRPAASHFTTKMRIDKSLHGPIDQLASALALNCLQLGESASCVSSSSHRKSRLQFMVDQHLLLLSKQIVMFLVAMYVQDVASRKIHRRSIVVNMPIG